MERYECPTCCYATNSYSKFLEHGKTHAETSTAVQLKSKFKLFLISQGVNERKGSIYSAVVYARNAQEAANMDPDSGLPIDWKDHGDYIKVYWAANESDVTVEEIGIASPSVVMAGTVCVQRID